MASLTIGDAITFHFASTRTESYTVEPVMDPSGRHLECHRVTLDVVGLVNRVSIATGRAVRDAVGPDFPGDSLPTSVHQLTEQLKRPRSAVVYRVGGVTVLDSPRRKANGARLSCDARGGPFPAHAKFVQFTGDETAILHYRVVVHDSEGSNMLLAHSWDVDSQIDRYGYTTRAVRGRAVFRKDYIDDALLGGDTVQPDAFRQSLFPPVPLGMRRVGVEVSQPTAADELDYVVVDREVTTGLGDDSDVVEVTGAVTSSVDYALKSPQAAGNLIGDFFNNGLNLNFGNMFGQAFRVAVPLNANRGTCRATGRKGADRARLARVAKSFILDRLAPVYKQAQAAAERLPNPKGPNGVELRPSAITSLAVSHSLDSDGPPWAEVTVEVFGPNPFTVKELVEGGVFKLTRDLLDEDGALFAGESMKGPALPGGGGTRGTWMRRLVSQRLAAPADQDALPPDPRPDAPSVGFPRAR